MNRPTILITGGAGYIGSYTGLLYAQQGYTCILLDENFPNHYSWGLCLHGDYADQHTIADVFKRYPIDAVIHCAAIDSQLHGKNNIDHYQKDLNKTITLLNGMVEHGIKKCVFASSAHVYGKHEGLLSVDLQKYPHTTYGKSKSLIEDLLADFYQTHSLCSASLRYFGVSGQLPDYALMQKRCVSPIGALINAIKKDVPFVHAATYNTPDGSLIRDFIHVWDIAHANVKAYQHLQHNGGADRFNIGSGNGISLTQLIQEAQKIFTTKIKVVISKEPTAEPAIVIADISKTVDLLHWKPSHSDVAFILKSTYAAM